jgi:nicotinamidase-related amidase
MLLSRFESCVLMIDMQEKLLQQCLDPNMLTQHASWVLGLARDCDVPILWSEHYPQNLGSTILPLREILEGQQPIPKTTFSCYAEPKISSALKQLKRKQVILIGIEAHICVMQTAIELKQAGFSVFVIQEAISSRFDHDLQLTLKRFEHKGIETISCEMLFFEWLRDAKDPLFKQLRKRYLS